jgi:hypothetical protein
MPNASANRAELRYVAESTFGTTPATPALKYLRFKGESLNPGFETVRSDEIRSDRNDVDLIKVGQKAAGNVEFELSYTSYDDFLEALMCSTWTVDGVDTDKFTLVNGVLERQFTIQKKLTDVNQFFNFTGSKINTGNLKIAPGAVVTGTFGIMARSGARTGAQFAGATTPAGTSTTPMNGSSGVTVNTIDAGAIPGGLMSFSLDINNNRREQDAIGSDLAQDIVMGRFEATGDFEVYFADGTLFDKLAAQTPFAFQTKMAGPGTTNEIWIDIPKAKFESGEVVAKGTDTDVMFKAKYRALFDTTTAGSLKLTRNGPL